MKLMTLFLFLLVIVGMVRAEGDNFDSILLIINYNHAHYESIPLIKEIYEPYFKNIVFYGPEHHPEVHQLAHNNGYFSYLCIADAMERYPHFAGYFFLMDDCILNVWLLKGIDQSKIWFPAIPFLDSVCGNPINITCGENAKLSWPWWTSQWGWEPMTKAYDSLSMSDKEILAFNWGPSNVVAAFSDIVYIPALYKKDFITLASIFGKEKAFLETALPTIVSCLCPKNEWIWLSGFGAFGDQKNINFRLDVTFNHPIKLSYQENQILVSKLFEQIRGENEIKKPLYINFFNN